MNGAGSMKFVTPLSYDALEVASAAFTQQCGIHAMTLVIPPELLAADLQLRDSMLKPDLNSYDVNPWYKMLEISVVPALGASTWYLVDQVPERIRSLVITKSAAEWMCTYCGVPNPKQRYKCQACGGPRGFLYEAQ